MLVEVTIFPDGRRTHEVIERDKNENCERIHQLDTAGITGEEKTGPDCDTVHETN